jgi:Polyketide cyclase / dehydrase and lipid transport
LKVGVGYKFEHAVECPVGRDFAWRFWSDVGNWAAVDSSVEWVKLDGPFARGTKGTTKPRGFAVTEWVLAEVQDGRSAVIEVAAPGAVLRFSWAFEEQAAGVTRITQRVSLEGERAGDYAGAMKEFEAGIPAGMSNLARAMARAANDAA